MTITLENVVLFLHIAVVVVSFMIAGVLHAAFHALPRAKTVNEMRLFAILMHRLEPLLPILAIFILGFGAWLVHLQKADGVGWGSGWVDAGITTLVIVEGLAGAILAPRTRQLVALIAATPDGPVPDQLRQETLNPVVWNVGHIATFGLLGVVFVMAVKPHGWVAAIAILIAVAIGLALSRAQLNAAQRLLSSSGASGST